MNGFMGLERGGHCHLRGDGENGVVDGVGLMHGGVKPNR